MDISTFQSNLDFIKSLHFNEEWKDENCRDTILAALEEANKKIENAFGESIQRLFAHKPTAEAVEKVVKKFPSTLSYEDVNGLIPIQKAAFGHGGFKYVPIMAKKGTENKVGGEDARGGLLLIDPSDRDEWNTLQMLSNYGAENDSEEDAIHMLKELRKAGLLLKKDIEEQQLLKISGLNRSKKRFEYFASWDPEALINTRVGNKPLAHSISSTRLPVFLESSFKYHPHIGGLLFIKDDDGNIAIDSMCNRFGEKKTMGILYDLLTPKSDYPILHHVFTKAPQHKDLFMEYFPWATQLRDHHGRSFQQAVLAAGPDIMNANNFLFPMLTDDQIRERDPVTTLYPFAAMAVGENADLKKSFYLLRRHPSVLERRSRSSSTRTNIVTWKKRKRRELV
ncbi:hypothetical protein CTEN210_00546 [Chaetoceros tenuissimus]|uniref:Uncharacterized protein n=1 Tax=Chaetoceros tenuissimus TaxID=426638 RepID=A0AAD3GYH9_9STRA|nr:hypothetical protein CTEN210_00546 [Chaetoceros tenuissimus]